LYKNIEKLEKSIEKANGKKDLKSEAVAFRDLVIPAMTEVRNNADELETIVDAEYWPMPTYSQLLFNI
jgi:glutamine synthetase